MGSIRSNSVSSRSLSVINTATSKAVTRDGLIVSTFHQHHQAFEIRQKTRWHSLLVTLWLMSTKTFIKAGLLEEANKALGEAEQLGLGDPGVWYELGQLNLRARDLIQEKKKPNLEDIKAIKEMNQVASDAFEKALILDPDHIPSQVAKATRLFESNQVELAEGLLEQVTFGLGWDSAEAWYQHAKLKATTGELDRAKRCFLFALELNDTEPIRNLDILNRFV
jgi:tetratricopeptide (TPR) repeat protein